MKSVLFPYSVYSIFIFLYTVLKNVDSFSNETPLCCSEIDNTQQFCCGFDQNYFRQWNWAKTVNILSKI